jgi:hypothetical protein
MMDEAGLTGLVLGCCSFGEVSPNLDKIREKGFKSLDNSVAGPAQVGGVLGGLTVLGTKYKWGCDSQLLEKQGRGKAL